MDPLPRPTFYSIVLGALSFGFYNDILRRENSKLLYAQQVHYLTWKNGVNYSDTSFKFKVELR
jgi:hypothetical protein